MMLSQKKLMNSNELAALLRLLETDGRFKLILTFESEEEKIQQAVTGIAGQGYTGESQIASILRQLGIAPHLKGYEYLKTAVKLKSFGEEAMESMTKHLYPEIARRHKTTAGKVEHAIRHAIEGAWCRPACSGENSEKPGEDILQQIRGKIFGYSSAVSRRKPTNGEFIAAVTDYFTINCEETGAIHIVP